MPTERIRSSGRDRALVKSGVRVGRRAGVAARVLGCALGGLLSAAPAAQHHTLGDLSIHGAWSRELPPVAPNGAAYFHVRNGGSDAVRIVSVSSPVADRAELHAHESDGGVMKMRHVHEVEVPAGEAISLEPGGLHVMLIGLKQPLVDGESFPLTVEFDNAGTIEVTVEITREGRTDHSGHADDGHGRSQ